jgi:hypothetical protein
MNNTNTYEERQSVSDLGEELFEEWANRKGYKLNRIGFHSKYDSVPNFFRLSDMLRNMPDYVLTTNQKTYVVNVKGTANIKHREISLLNHLILCYSSPKAPLIYAFCFKGQDPVLMSTDTLLERFSESEDKTWHDGVMYRTIKI